MILLRQFVSLRPPAADLLDSVADSLAAGLPSSESSEPQQASASPDPNALSKSRMRVGDDEAESADGEADGSDEESEPAGAATGDRAGRLIPSKTARRYNYRPQSLICKVSGLGSRGFGRARRVPFVAARLSS